MAHNLNIVNGVAAMAYNSVGEDKRPWHDLGTPCFGLMSTEEALNKGGLNFTVEKHPLFCHVGTEIVSIPEKYATVRSDNKAILGTVGEQYKPIQNIEAFNFFDNLVSEKQAMFETVGALGKGERVWIMAKLPNDIIVKSDVVETYLLLSNSHDGSATLNVQFTPVRVVCQNTLNIALSGNQQKVKIRHSKNSDEKLALAHEVLGITKKIYKQTQEYFTAMDNKIMTPLAVSQYLDTLFNVKEKEAVREAKGKRKTARLGNIVEQVEELFTSGKGNKGNSLWDLYNGVTEWADHHRDLREGTTRWESSMFGTGAPIKEQAFQLAVASL